MWKVRYLMKLGGLLAATALLAAPPASAANTPTFRDCSVFVPGFDPDFVELFGVTVDSRGDLTVPASQHKVQLEASESSDPGDSAGHVTLVATVTASGVRTQTESGAGVGKVLLSVPLVGAGPGGSYTIGWTATFDNGNHACPSPLTPENTSPNPFVVKVS